jgi:CheY-like chemotaxis protein
MLKGSGASFGFPVVSEVGALVEDAGDTELGNRASELVYVLRSIAQSKEAPKARVVVYLSRTEHRSTVGLVFPDSVISDDWEHVAAKVRAGDADVLVCEASEVTEQGVVAVRAAGSQVPIVVLDEGRHSAWRARGADRVLAYPPDPVALSATIRGFARAEGAETGIEERAAFLRRLAGEQDALRVEPHTLFALRGPAGAAVGSLVRQSSATELGVRLGRFEGGLLALVPDRVSGPFLAGLPPDTHARCALASVPLGGSEGISRLVTRLIARVGQLGDGERVQLTSAKAAKRVVVVEDDRDVAELVEQVVAGGGHTVEHHVDGAAALQALLASPPDLVVLDIDLPSLDGLAILERLRRHDETADVPVLMLTAHDGESDVVEALELGASDHVAKPFEVGVLNARIRRLLR